MSRFGVRRIFIFGSYAREEQTSQSDVDIAVELERPLGWEIVDLHDYLEEILNTRAAHQPDDFQIELYGSGAGKR